MRKLLFFFLSLPFFSQAQKNYYSLIDKYMQAQVRVNDFSGAVLVAQKGKIMYDKAFGMANRGWNIPNTSTTKFRIGSLTKQFTAAAIMQLAEAGKLKLDDRLSQYLPHFPKADSVTLHMLLTHTSGIKSYTGIAAFSKIAALPYSTDSVIAFFKKEPYDFSPGTKYRYNNSGYFLLGYIIEKVSGQSYSDYVFNGIIKKAGLANTSVDRLDSILQNRSEGYTKTKTGWRHADYLAMEFPYSAGAIVSTTGDLYKWNKALFGGQVVSPAMVNKMTTPFMDKYGYGFYIDSSDNHQRIAHGGAIPGFLSHNIYFPTDDIHIIVLSNNFSNSTGIANTLSSVLFNKEVVPPYKHVAVRFDSGMLRTYVGKYRSIEGVLEVLLKEGKLYRRSEGKPVVELMPESATKFFYGDGSDRQLNFILSNTKDIRTVQLILNGVVHELKKIG